MNEFQRSGRIVTENITKNFWAWKTQWKFPKPYTGNQPIQSIPRECHAIAKHLSYKSHRPRHGSAEACLS